MERREVEGVAVVVGRLVRAAGVAVGRRGGAGILRVVEIRRVGWRLGVAMVVGFCAVERRVGGWVQKLEIHVSGGETGGTWRGLHRESSGFTWARSTFSGPDDAWSRRYDREDAIVLTNRLVFRVRRSRCALTVASLRAGNGEAAPPSVDFCKRTRCFTVDQPPRKDQLFSMARGTPTLGNKVAQVFSSDTIDYRCPCAALTWVSRKGGVMLKSCGW